MDESQFDHFYLTRFNAIVGQVYAMCGNLAEAQDCVQEAFVRAWDHRTKLDPAGHPEAWVRTTAYRLAVSHWRRATRGRRAPDRALEVPRNTEPSPDRVAVTEALKQLPEKQRRAIVLHHLCDLTVAEVAAETGIPTGTIKAQLVRGRETLARLLNSDLEARHA